MSPTTLPRCIALSVEAGIDLCAAVGPSDRRSFRLSDCQTVRLVESSWSCTPSYVQFSVGLLDHDYDQDMSTVITVITLAAARDGTRLDVVIFTMCHHVSSCV